MVNQNQIGLTAIVVVFLIILALIGALFAFDLGYIAYLNSQNITPPLDSEKQTVTANGSFNKGKYIVSLSLTFPLEGGTVTGYFSGDCKGNINGTYDGQDGGLIEAKASGSCDPFFVPVPSSAIFSGFVLQQQKTVSLNGTGSAAGFSGNGSMVLTF